MNRSVSKVETHREPLTLRDAKKHLEISDGDQHHDAHILSLIVAAREQWEHDTNSLAVRRSVTETLADFPGCDWKLYYPLTEQADGESSITHLQADGSEQTVSDDVYSIDACNRVIHLLDAQQWPAKANRWDAVRITYTAGLKENCEIVRHALRLQVDAMFELRGMTNEKDKVLQAYENLVTRFMRSTYP